jgi:purine-nucleoside/S-methyl-5'-thioadenosine phosphorylase / adenosine deaminase
MAPLAEALAAAGLDWIVPDWPAPAGVRAFSTTRNVGAGHVSTASSAARAGVEEAILRWLPSPPRWLRQVHGSDVYEAYEDPATSERPRADAIVTRSVDIACAIQTADCLPVLFADRAGSVVAAAHAGWRGLAAGVLEATLGAMRSEPGRILAWIGPGIGPRAYEVGADVRDAHCAADPGAAACFVARSRDKWLADLVALAHRRLDRAGVRSIHGGGHCTFTEATLFHSYRRDGARAGRMVTVIWRTE